MCFQLSINSTISLIARVTSLVSARVNGFACIDTKQAHASHFSFSGLHAAKNTANAVFSTVTPVFVGQLPGLNTVGISMAHTDYAPKGVVPPHTHPRASEIITVLEGTLQVGFVTSNPENGLSSKILKEGDAFVFLQGLVHFAHNVGTESATSVSALSSENPGVVLVANSVFGSTPSITNDLLARAFQTDKAVIDHLQA